MAQEKGYEQFTRRSNVNLLGKKPSQSARDYLKQERDRSDREDKKKKKEAELRKLREINAKPIVEKKTGSRKGAVTGKIETDTKKGVDKTNKKALSGFDYGAPKQAQPDYGAAGASSTRLTGSVKKRTNRQKAQSFGEFIGGIPDMTATDWYQGLAQEMPDKMLNVLDTVDYGLSHLPGFSGIEQAVAGDSSDPNYQGTSKDRLIRRSLERNIPDFETQNKLLDGGFTPDSKLLDTRQDDVVNRPISDRLRAIANKVMGDRGIVGGIVGGINAVAGAAASANPFLPSGQVENLQPGGASQQGSPVLAGAPLSQEYGSDSVDFRQHSGGQPSQPTVPGGTPQQPSALQGFDFGAPIASSTPVQGSNNQLSQSPQPATNLGGTPGSFVLPGSPDRPSQPGIGEAPVQAIPQTPVNYPRVDRSNPGEGGVTQAPVNPTLSAQPTAPVAPTQPQLKGSPGGSISPSTYGYGGRSAAGVDTSGIAYSEPVRTSNNRLSQAPAAPSVGSTYQLPGQSGRPASPGETAAIQERFNRQRDNQARIEYERQKRIHERGFEGDPELKEGDYERRKQFRDRGRRQYYPGTHRPPGSPSLDRFVPGGTRQEARRSPGPVSKVSGRPPLSPEDLQGLRDAYKGGTQLNQEQAADLLRSIGDNKDKFFQGGGGGSVGATGATGASQSDTYELTPEEELDFDIATKDMSEEEKDQLLEQLTRRGLQDSSTRQWMADIERLLETQTGGGAWNPRQFLAWEPMWWDPYLGMEA